MNYLAHLYLSSHTDATLVGALLGDFVKVDHYRDYPPAVAEAILLHRRIDSFTDAHPLHRASKRRLDGRFRHTRGLMVDLFYDHFLARSWDRWATIPLNEFAQRVYAAMQTFKGRLPTRLERMLPYMIKDDWLCSYRELENVQKALAGLSRRLSRTNYLAEGLAELEQNYTGLESDFQQFFPQLQQYVAGAKPDRPNLWHSVTGL